MQDECACDADALSLSAAEFVGVSVVPVGVEADVLHEGEDLVFEGGRSVRSVLIILSILIIQRFRMDFEGFGDGVADGDSWVEAGVGVLEDDLQFGAQGAHLSAVELVEGCAAVEDGAVGVVDESQQCASEGAFAAAAFAHQAEGFAFMDVEGDAVDGGQGLQGFSEQAAFEGVGYGEG